MNLVLIDDHLAYRESFRLALSELSNFTVIGEAQTGREGIALVEKLEPDLTVIDLILPDTDGMALARELRRRRVRTKTLLLGRMAHPLFLRDALKYGVGGVALKQQPLEEIIGAMGKVLAGERYLSPVLEQQLTEQLESTVPNVASLSPREREVLFLLSVGMSSKEIATALFLSSKTVDAHRLHINRKLGVRSPAALARLLIDQKLIEA